MDRFVNSLLGPVIIVFFLGMAIAFLSSIWRYRWDGDTAPDDRMTVQHLAA